LRWEPNAPDAVLAVVDSGLAVLALNPHVDEPNQDCVVFVGSGTWAAVMGPPKDEAPSGHRLSMRCPEATWLCRQRRRGRAAAMTKPSGLAQDPRQKRAFTFRAGAA
jgi:hypothetical protein